MYKILGKQEKCQAAGCGQDLYTKISVVKFLSLRVSTKNGNDEDLLAEQALEILKKIKTVTARILLSTKLSGKNRQDDDFLLPRDLILTKLLVPPP